MYAISDSNHFEWFEYREKIAPDVVNRSGHLEQISGSGKTDLRDVRIVYPYSPAFIEMKSMHHFPSSIFLSPLHKTGDIPLEVAAVESWNTDCRCID